MYFYYLLIDDYYLLITNSLFINQTPLEISKVSNVVMIELGSYVQIIFNIKW